MTSKTTKTTLVTSIVFASVISMFALTGTGIHNVDAEQTKYSQADLKPGQVFTPFGPWDADKVLPYDGTPIDADAIRAEWKNTHPGETSPAEKAIQKRMEAKLNQNNNRGLYPPGFTDGWNMYAQWITAYDLEKFTGNWIVPSDPSSYTSSSSDVIYTFTGLQNADDDMIIQPVLQYGASPACTAEDWKIASWWVGGDFVFYSSCKSADPDDEIYGEMVNTSGQTWSITTKNEDTNQSTTLQVNTGDDWPHAFVSFESYGLPPTCAYIPGDIDYTNLEIDDGSRTPSWSDVYGYTWCGMDVDIVSSSTISLNNNN